MDGAVWNKTVVVLLTSVALAISGCTNDTKSTPTTATTEPTSSAAAPTTTKAPEVSNPAAARGIIVASYDSGICTIYAVDPYDGSSNQLVKFSNAPKEYQCWRLSPALISPDLTKIGVTFNSDNSTGWVDAHGNQTILAQRKSSDFGDNVDRLTPPEFDAHGTAYYSAEINGVRTFFRVPAGSNGPGELIGTAEGNKFLGKTAGGTLSVLPKEQSEKYHIDGACGVYDSTYDPDRVGPYYHTRRGMIYKMSQYCDLNGTQITREPRSNLEFDSLAKSPDGSRIAAQGAGNLLYIADVSGDANAVPKAITVPVLRKDGGWQLLGWR